MKAVIATGAFAAAMFWACGPAQTAAPEPAEISPSWALDIRFEKPRSIRVQVPGEDEPRRFWFLRYVVTNQTGEDRIFVPEFVLYTDTGQILRAGQNAPSAVFDKLKGIYNDPLLKDLTGMTGKILQGEDNSKRGVAIFPDFDPKAGAFDLFIGGLSGESVTVELLEPIEVTEYDERGEKVSVEKTSVVLSKTLHLRYEVPGSAAHRGQTQPKLVEKDWVMR